MKCPTCPDGALVMTERSGVEIDYCPTCRGVWLDRGELDKIIERSNALVAPAARAPERRDDGYDDRHRDDDRDRDWDRDRDRDDDRDHDRGSRRPKRRRESLLSELFDF